MIISFLYKKQIIFHNNIGDNMENKKYQQLVNKHKPKEKRLENLIISFLVGGLVGLLGQVLIEFYTIYLNVPLSQAGTYMSVTFVFFASLFTTLGFFDKWVNFAKCGLIIPITGFSHSMTSAAMDYKSEGLVTGIGSNMFKLAGSVILYGIVSAWIFGMIRFFIGG